MRNFFLVVNACPGDLEAALRLELNNADIQFLVSYHGGGRVDITRLHDLSYTLVQRPLQNRFGGAVCCMRRRETKFDWIMS